VGLKERDFLWIDGDTIAQVMAVMDDKYALDTDYETISSVQKMFGVYFVAPSPIPEE